jgi:short-subunit dehydrogenase
MNEREKNAVNLRNKVVVITGAARGIGRETAHAFGREQSHLLLIDWDAEALASAQAEVQQYGERVYTLSIDLTEASAPSEITAYALEQFGRVDVLVNNAGVLVSGDFLSHDEAVYRRMFEVNVLAVIRLTRAVAQVMRDQHSGHIVNVASMAAVLPSIGFSVYGASKGAVRTFSASLRRELRRDGIMVSSVCPGFVNTQMVGHMTREQMRQAGMLDPLLGLNLIPPYEVADAIVRAVVYREAEVIVGDRGYHLLALLERLSPRLVDAMFERLIPRDLLLEVSRYPN